MFNCRKFRPKSLKKQTIKHCVEGNSREMQLFTVVQCLGPQSTLISLIRVCPLHQAQLTLTVSYSDNSVLSSSLQWQWNKVVMSNVKCFITAMGNFVSQPKTGLKFSANLLGFRLGLGCRLDSKFWYKSNGQFDSLVAKI